MLQVLYACICMTYFTCIALFTDLIPVGPQGFGDMGRMAIYFQGAGEY